jgi:hypothetical protein
MGLWEPLHNVFGPLIPLAEVMPPQHFDRSIGRLAFLQHVWERGGGNSKAKKSQ